MDCWISEAAHAWEGRRGGGRGGHIRKPRERRKDFEEKKNGNKTKNRKTRCVLHEASIGKEEQEFEGN